MCEIIKIIARVITGLIPFVWGVSMWLTQKYDKCDMLCGVLTICLAFIGVVACIDTATGF